LNFGGIKIRDEHVHVTANGKRMLVLHGDRFDGVIACAKWLAYVGDSLYTMILKFNQIFNVWRARVGLPYWSLSQYLKLKVKNANKKAAKSFRARHNCAQKKDRTTAGYWSCNVGRYAKQLGLSSSNSW
jgi:UDP-2,3-diacylglucosamine pyrophosphatase LpxH